MRIFINRTTGSQDGGGPILDMTADGQFRTPPQPTLSDRIFGYAVIAAVIAGGLAVAALALWFAMILIPIAILAGLVAYATLRWRLWRAGITLRGGPTGRG